MIELGGIAQGGDAVGRWEERVVFATGGIPGETVRLRLTEQRSNFARGHVIEVLQASPERVTPRLAGADHLAWQHIDYQAQLRFRRQIIAEQLQKFGVAMAHEVEATLPASPPWGYRNSARLHVADHRIGYHNAGGRDVVALDHDPLLLPGLNEALANLSDVLREPTAALPPFEALIRISETYDYTVGTLLAPADAIWQVAARWRARTPQLAGVAIGTLRHQAAIGETEIVEEFAGLSLLLSPTTFFQVNLAAAAQLLALVRRGLALNGTERLLDLYCGAGTFALPLAREAAEVIGIEEYAPAVVDAQSSAAANQIDNVRFLSGSVESQLGTLSGTIDAAVLDPPRRGCHPRALQALIQLAPQRIVYVACHPGTLARDLVILSEAGYQIDHVVPVDLFPQTAHIECVTTLTRR